MFCCKVKQNDILGNNPPRTPPASIPLMPPPPPPPPPTTTSTTSSSSSSEPIVTLQEVMGPTPYPTAAASAALAPNPPSPPRPPSESLYSPPRPLFLLNEDVKGGYRVSTKPMVTLSGAPKTVYIRDGVADLRHAPGSLPAILDTLPSKTLYLRAVILSGHPFTETAAKLLTLWASQSQVLEQLYLSSCKLKALAARLMLTLCSEAASCPQLTLIDLSHNGIDFPTVRSIARALETSPPHCHLDTLLVHHNPLTLEGVTELLRANTLLCLDARFTFSVPPPKPNFTIDRVTWQRAQATYKASLQGFYHELTSTPSLQDLYLDENAFGNAKVNQVLAEKARGVTLTFSDDSPTLEPPSARLQPAPPPPPPEHFSPIMAPSSTFLSTNSPIPVVPTTTPVSEETPQPPLLDRQPSAPCFDPDGVINASLPGPEIHFLNF